MTTIKQKRISKRIFKLRAQLYTLTSALDGDAPLDEGARMMLHKAAQSIYKGLGKVEQLAADQERTGAAPEPGESI